MHTPSVDIIVPVWNSPFETRACLSAILTHSPDARLIVVDNGSNRETQVMLEEFSEPLGERALFITSERNLGLVPAVNIGLERSERDLAVIVRPHVQVAAGWLAPLVEAAGTADCGMVSPVFTGEGAPDVPPLMAGCDTMETFDVCFSTLAIRQDVFRLMGGFDEDMDGGRWCLRDYVARAWNRGYRTLATTRSVVVCREQTVFGSEERRRELTGTAIAVYRSRWKAPRQYAVYLGQKLDQNRLHEDVDALVQAARAGHEIDLFLHRRQVTELRRNHAHPLHTGIRISQLSLLAPQRDLARRLARLKTAQPDIILVRETADPAVPLEGARPFSDVFPAVCPTGA